MTMTTEALPDLSEYDGMSSQDIAIAILNWPEGSEDQLRAIEALRARAPGRGHNRPPLDETLDEELAPRRARQAELLAVAKKAVIVDADSAAKVTDLVKLMRDFETDLEKDMQARIKPYRDATALIRARYADIARQVEIARQGEDGRGGLRLALTKWADKVEAEAEAERQRALEEQRKRDVEAAEAARKAQEAATSGSGSVAAELKAAEAAEEAERARQRAEAVRPAPIRSHMGQVTRSREIRWHIESVTKAIAWIVKQPGGASAAVQFASTFLGKYLRGLGVDVVEKGVQIPGVTVTVEKGAASVRR